METLILRGGKQVVLSEEEFQVLLGPYFIPAVGEEYMPKAAATVLEKLEAIR
jgi:hypothetical protein